MDRVIIERPRYGSWMKGPKTRGRIRLPQMDGEEDLGPKKIRRRFRMSGSEVRRVRGTKDFSDLLSPLHRFLEKQVGRSWNGVYSEIMQSIDRRSVRGWHFLLHLDFYVETRCRTGEDGHVYGANGSLGRRPVTGFYVHPETGILCFSPYTKYKVKRNKLLQSLPEFGLQTEGNSYFVIADKETVLQFRDGIWYIMKFESRDPSEFVTTGLNSEGERVIKTRKEAGLPLKVLVNSNQLGRRRLKRYRHVIKKSS